MTPTHRCPRSTQRACWRKQRCDERLKAQIRSHELGLGYRNTNRARFNTPCPHKLRNLDAGSLTNSDVRKHENTLESKIDAYTYITHERKNRSPAPLRQRSPRFPCLISNLRRRHAPSRSAHDAVLHSAGAFADRSQAARGIARG